MQELLSRIRPGWKWEPTLLEVDEQGNAGRAFTGSRLSAHLVRELGLRQAARLLRVVRKSLRSATLPAAADDRGGVSRRQVLRWTGGGLGAIALGLGAVGTAAAEPPEPVPGTMPVALPVSKSDVASLRALPVVAEVTRRFGSPDWTSAQRLTGKGSAIVGYVVQLQARKGQPGSAMALVRRHEGAPLEAVLLSAEKQSDQVVITLRTPLGGAIATIRAGRDGSHAAMAEGAADAILGANDALGMSVEPDAKSWNCIIDCLAVHVGETCLDICIECVDIIGCVPCAACAGFWLVCCTFWVC